MTVPVTVNSNIYIGNGAANVYSFTFLAFIPANLQVTVKDTLTPSTTYLIQQGQDYTVAGLNPAGGPPSTGSITLVDNGQTWLSGGFLLTGYTLTITRVVSLVQNTSIRNQGDYFPEVIENALDYITMALQQIQGQLPPSPTISLSPATLVILSDTVNGHTYKLLMVNGVLSTQQVT